MFPHEALRLRLLADAGVVAITESIYPGVLSQGVTLPAVAYRIVDKTTEPRLESRGHPGVTELRIRFFSTCDVAEGGYDTAKDLDEAIRLCLEGFAGEVTDLTSSPVESLNIQGIFHLNTVDGYDDTTQTHQVITDYSVWAAEVQPT